MISLGSLLDLNQPAQPGNYVDVAVLSSAYYCFLVNGVVSINPMYAENRRLERREDILTKLENEGF